MEPGRDGFRLVVASGEIPGSIVIDRAAAENEGTHLRWFSISDKPRGSGARLPSATLDFCRNRRYREVLLWTFYRLHAARHLHEKYGFKLAWRQLGTQWGKEGNEQLFVRSEA